ncbi:MAG: hypothetical protein ABIU54_09500 [Candidatus Eisenbacteria bacterium]
MSKFDFPHVIETEAGPLMLLELGESTHAALMRWPKGIREFDQDGERMVGLVVEDEEGACDGLRAVYGHHELEEDAERILFMQFILLPGVARRFIQHGFRGLLMPCVHLEKMPEGHYESGQLMIASSDDEREVGLACDPIPDFEAAFGPGSTNQLLTYLRDSGLAWNETGLPTLEMTELEPSSCEVWGPFLSGLMIVDDRVVLTRDLVDDQDPFLAEMVRAGFDQVEYARVVFVRTTDDPDDDEASDDDPEVANEGMPN